MNLQAKARATESRAHRAPAAYRRLLTPKGDVCAATADLPVPVRVVIDHQALIPLSGAVSACNKAGNPGHDPRAPVFFWYQDTPIGKEIYAVLYTLPCAWARCSFCSLPSESSPVDVSPGDIRAQMDRVFASLTREELGAVRRLFLSNNGSILDEETMPPEILLEIAESAHRLCPGLEVVCFETRFETATLPRLLGLQQRFEEWHHRDAAEGAPRRLAPRPVVLQISAGYETQDPYLRNAVLWKGYDEERVQGFFAMLAELEKQSGAPAWVDEYVPRPAAGMTDDEGVDETVETVAHLAALGAHFRVAVSVRMNPTFAAVGSELYLQFERQGYRPPTYRDIVRALAKCHERGLAIPIFVGLNNEGLSYEHGSFGNHDETDAHYRRAIGAFNVRRQDHQCPAPG